MEQSIMINSTLVNNLDPLELQQLMNYLKGKEIESLKVKQIVDSLSEAEIKKFTSPISEKSVLADPPVLGGRIQMGPLYIPFKPFWLHAKAEVETYFLYTKYTYSAFTSKDIKGKEKMEVDEIKLSIQRDVGFESYTKSKKNTSEFKFIDEVYGSMNTGGRTKLTATGSKKSVGVNFSVTVEVYID